jgi:hypothetical protein
MEALFWFGHQLPCLQVVEHKNENTGRLRGREGETILVYKALETDKQMFYNFLNWLINSESSIETIFFAAKVIRFLVNGRFENRLRCLEVMPLVGVKAAHI